jgi:predicted ABC-type ATPase
VADLSFAKRPGVAVGNIFLAQRSLVIVGGVNGSGKSTFAASAAGTAALLGQQAINPDDLTVASLAEQPEISQVGANLVGVERAEKSVWRAIAENRSVAVETVLSSSKYIPVVLAARRRGYRTRLIFIGLPTVELALARISARVAQGGHDVPEPSVRARWVRAHDNLLEFDRVVSDVVVFSNDGDQPVLVAERVGRTRMKLIARDKLPEVSRRLLAQHG